MPKRKLLSGPRENFLSAKTAKKEPRTMESFFFLFLKKIGPGLKKNANSQIFVSVQIGHDTLDYIELN